MELKHPQMDNDLPTAWANSDETNTSTFQTFTYTAPFERVTWQPLSSGQELHMFLVGDSHLIVKDVSMRLNGAWGSGDEIRSTMRDLSSIPTGAAPGISLQ